MIVENHSVLFPSTMTSSQIQQQDASIAFDFTTYYTYYSVLDQIYPFNQIIYLND